jgi:hypothetical protein
MIRFQEPRPHQPREVRMELGLRQVPVDHAEFHVHVRKRVHERDHLALERPAGVHDVQAEPPVPRQHVLEVQRVAMR